MSYKSPNDFCDYGSVKFEYKDLPRLDYYKLLDLVIQRTKSDYVWDRYVVASFKMYMNDILTHDWTINKDQVVFEDINDYNLVKLMYNI